MNLDKKNIKKEKRTPLSRRQFIKRGVLATAIIAFIDAYWFEKYIIDWNEFDLAPTEENKIKVIQITDLHLQEIRSFHHNIARQINRIKPDFVFITGDSVESSDKIEALHDFLQLIDYEIPKYAILGNWEYWGAVDLEKLRAVYTQNNCELLINEGRKIAVKGRTINIIGIDDLVGGQANFLQAMQGLEIADTVLVLTHCPQHREHIALEKGNLKIDLVLCGHTHGGQIAFLGYAPITPIGSGRYVRGWYKDLNLPTYVSKGIGTSVYPFRFGARAEVAVFEL